MTTKEEPKYTISNLDNDKYKDYSVAKEEPKQETLEDTAKKFTENLYYKVGDVDEFYGEPLAVYDAFIAGAKWQAERMYSEEDMRTAIFKSFLLGYDKVYSNELEDIIIEQFKKEDKQ